MILGRIIFIALALASFLIVTGCSEETGKSATSQTHVKPSPASVATKAADKASAFQQSSPSKGQSEQYLTLVQPKRPPKMLELVSIPVSTAPMLDGLANDQVWETAPHYAEVGTSRRHDLLPGLLS